MKHTPGPWEVIEMEGSKDLYIESRHKKGWNEFVFAEMISYGDAGKEEQEANAQLIASAPELLEACKKAFSLSCERIDCRANTNQVNHGYCVNHQHILQVITKAEGI